MNIWLLTTSMEIGGAERMVVTLASGLSARGHEVLVWGRAGELDRQLEPVACARTVVPHGRAATDALRLRRDLSRRRPDVVHTMNVRMTAVALAARAGRRRSGPRVVATFVGVPPARYPLAARVLGRADVVAAVSHDLARAVRGRVADERLRVILTAAPEPELPTAALAAELRPVPGPLVVAVGRLVAEKNHARFLEAMTVVAARHPTARFVVVGDGPLRQQLEAQAAALGLSGRLRFTGWRDDAPAIAAAADVVVFSSDSEGRSIAALEALAAGTPVVTTPAPGMAELVLPSAGVVTASMSADELGRAVAGLLADPAALAAMGRRAAQSVAGASIEAMLDEYEQVYVAS